MPTTRLLTEYPTSLSVHAGSTDPRHAGRRTCSPLVLERVDDGVHAVFRANERDARAEPVAAALGACPVALVAGDSDLQAVRAVELVVLTPPSPEIGPRSVHFTGAAAALQPLRRGETRPSWRIAALYFIGAAISLAILVFVIG
jgi:hypothetical protein